MLVSKKISISIFSAVAVILVAVVLFSYFRNDGLVYTPLARAGGINIAVPATMEGNITGIFVSDYQKVTKGQMMFKLDDSDIIIGIEAGKLKVDSLTKKIKSKEQVIEYSKAKVKSIEETIAANKLEIENLKRQVEMYGSLSDRNAISKNEFLNLQSKQIVATQRIQSSKADLLAQNASQLQAIEDRDVAELELEIASKEIDYLKWKLTASQIKAPSDGYTERINVINGQYVTNGFLITRLDVVTDGHTPVVALFSENQIDQISDGDEVYVRFNIDTANIYKGKVVGIAKSTLNSEQTSAIVGLWDVNSSQIRQAKKYIEVYIDIPQSVFINGIPVVEGMSASVAIQKY